MPSVQRNWPNPRWEFAQKKARNTQRSRRKKAPRNSPNALPKSWVTSHQQQINRELINFIKNFKNVSNWSNKLYIYFLQKKYLLFFFFFQPKKRKYRFSKQIKTWKIQFLKIFSVITVHKMQWKCIKQKSKISKLKEKNESFGYLKRK